MELTKCQTFLNQINRNNTSFAGKCAVALHFLMLTIVGAVAVVSPYNENPTARQSVDGVLRFLSRRSHLHDMTHKPQRLPRI